VERGDTSGLAEAAVAAARRGKSAPLTELQTDYGTERPSKLPGVIAGMVDKARSGAPRELIVGVASDGFSAVESADWLERISMLASHGTRVVVALSTSSDEVERKFVEAGDRANNPGLRVGVVRRDAASGFVFGREMNRAVEHGFALMPSATGVLCANDDTWPSHLSLGAVQSWLGSEGLTGGICRADAGRHQERPGFFRELLAWKTRFIDSEYRLSAFWLYLSRAAWTALGGFDEGFRGYGCDDTDLCLRAWKLGQPIRIDRACYVDHFAASSYERAADLSAMREEAIARFTLKHEMTPEMYQVPLRLMNYQDRRAREATA
jgi:hypothetical protein